MKAVIGALLVGALLSGCASNVVRVNMECRETQYVVLKDGRICVTCSELGKVLLVCKLEG